MICDRLLGGAVLALLLGASVAGHAGPLQEYKGHLLPNEELVTVSTRAGVTVRALLVTPLHQDASPKGIFLFFPGGEGFLVTSAYEIARLFTGVLSSRGFVVAVLDAPSDQPAGMSGNNELFRLSDRHAHDIRAMVDFASRKWQAPVFLIGHSLGSVSAAHAAASMNDKRIRALVMTASQTNRGPRGWWPSSYDASLRKLPIPVLIVHHRHDGCSFTPFSEAAELPRNFASSPKVDFMEVLGGHESSPNPCVGANHHSFLGLRGEVAGAIADWVDGTPTPKVIGP